MSLRNINAKVMMSVKRWDVMMRAMAREVEMNRINVTNGCGDKARGH